jgi:PAS domain S-box-containing protein
MRPGLTRFSTLVYAATICVVLLSGVTLYRNLHARSAAVERMSHTQQVMLQLEEIESLLKDAETGQRGYLLTGDRAYLPPYEQAQTRIEPALARLSDLTSDNPTQQSRIPQLRGMIDAKMTELADTVALYQQGEPAEALQVVHSNLGREVMEQIRALMSDMRAEETRLLAARQAALQRGTHLFLTIVLSTTVNLLLLIVIAGLHRQRIAVERANAEQLRIREEQFRTTLTSIGDAVITTDAEGRVTFVNQTAETILGRKLEECLQRKLAEVFPIYNEQTGAPAENPVHRVIASGQVSGLANHTVLKRRDGKQVPIEDSAAPIRDDRGRVCGVVLVFRDVTREREAQAALRRADRLMVTGRLAASVAHEINNPLEAVFNLIYLAINDPATSEGVRSQLGQAIQELNRVAHVTRQTLRFHRTAPGLTKVDVTALLDELMELFATRFSSRGIVVKRQHPPALQIVISPDDFKQVLSNLLANAGDAMPDGGEVTITMASPAETGDRQLLIRVEDTGCGIAPENQARIFEPFFTTKGETGTGLGLWVIKQLVEKHGGSVSVQSPAEGNTGARFDIHLPLVSALHNSAANIAAD